MYQLVYVYWYILDRGFPAGSMVKNPPAKTGDTGDSSFDPWVGKIPWRREWQPTPVFLPGESHGQRSLVGYSPWGPKETEQLNHQQWLLMPFVLGDLTVQR